MSGKWKEISDEMVGGVYADKRGNEVVVHSIVTYGAGYQVVFSYTDKYSVYCGLGKFRKRYTSRVR